MESAGGATSDGPTVEVSTDSALLYRALTIVIVLALIALAGQAVVWSFQEYDRWSSSRRDPADIFVYHSITYAGRISETELAFVSDVEWFVDNDGVEWSDRLICDGRIRPTQRDGRGGAEAGRTEAEWTLAVGVPTEGQVQSCYLQSLTTVTIDGTAFARSTDSDSFAP